MSHHCASVIGRIKGWIGPPTRFIRVIVASVLALGTTVAAVAESPQDDVPESHPLAAMLDVARSHADHIRSAIEDYSCVLAKRERIRNELQPYQFMQLQVRCGTATSKKDTAEESDSTDTVAKPLSVFIRYLKPRALRDRRAIYVAGLHNGKVLVRKGGPSFGYIRVEIDPDGKMAKNESNYPITDIGFDRMFDRLIEIISENVELDPDGLNTNVQQFKQAKVQDRVCTHYQVTHPTRHSGLAFHQANLYVDDRDRIPVRLTVYGWPETEGGDPLLLEEYTYINLELNVGLTDDDFDPSRLGDPSTDAKESVAVDASSSPPASQASVAR